MSIVWRIYKIIGDLVRYFIGIDGEWVSSFYLEGLVHENIGCKVIFLDGRYKVPTIDVWRKIIKADILDKVKKWREDVFDCDNFALVFSAHCAEFYGVNTAGIALGNVYDANTLELVGYHAYNVLVAKEDGKIVLYIYEPQTDGLAKASKKTRLGDWIYETEKIIFG